MVAPDWIRLAEPFEKILRKRAEQSRICTTHGGTGKTRDQWRK